MSIGGTWEIILHTPMGKQKGRMTTAVNGSHLSGEINSPMGIIVIDEGKVDGVTATWCCTVVKPITMMLEFHVKVEGDDLSGTVKVGPMGTNKVEAKRVS